VSAETVARVEPVAPTAGTLALLSVRPWLDYTVDGKTFAPMLITHRPGRRDDETPQAIEARMRGIANALGAAPAAAPLQSTGPRVAVHRGVVMVRLDGIEHVLTVRAGRWARIVEDLGQVLLVVGLDPLSQASAQVEVDQYIEKSVHSGGLYMAVAGVVESPRHLPPALEVQRP
jgi:hypothetical protein